MRGDGGIWSPASASGPTRARPCCELYDSALPEVYGYLLARCGARALAEDLTAETFLAAVTACRRTPPPLPSTGWLIGIARHKLVDHWRAVEREQRGLRAVAEPEAPTATTRGTSGWTRCWPTRCWPPSPRRTGPR